MRKEPLYSSSRESVSRGHSRKTDDNEASGKDSVVRAAPGRRRLASLNRYQPSRAFLVGSAGALLALLLALVYGTMGPSTYPVTQEEINAAVLHTLENITLPSPAAKAYEIIRPAVVRVRGLETGKQGEDVERSVGSGVVIVDKGIILTNLHVVLGAKRLQVVFADGLQSEATIIGVQPEHDLAVIQAQTIPDDLFAATMRSTADLRLGERVFAVGFPFGIGPSVTAGVVSGLRREFHSPEGKRVLTNLIQFDAAANPGSSGGPLITAEGEVVGIVTAILNPMQHRFFVGVAFAVPIENAAAAAGLPPF